MARPSQLPEKFNRSGGRKSPIPPQDLEKVINRLDPRIWRAFKMGCKISDLTMTNAINALVATQVKHWGTLYSPCALPDADLHIWIDLLPSAPAIEGKHS